MSPRIGWFIGGFVVALVFLVAAGYLFVIAGGVPMATSASPLPYEEKVAGMALRASLRGAKNVKDPLPATDSNLSAGAAIYHDYCSACHGTPDHGLTPLAQGMFPKPPQLFGGESVTDDPEGEIYWIVTNGIRLSGMPAFGKTLSDAQRWQVTALLKHGEELAPQVRTALTSTR